MPIHDWTRVSAGTFHHFHHYWVGEIARALNSGVLPTDYYAMAEQVAGSLGPDVLTLHARDPVTETTLPSPQGGLAVAVAPPKVDVVLTAEGEEYAAKQRGVVIRHSSADQIIAIVEVVSPGNKGSQQAFRTLVKKAVAVLQRGIHVLLLDLLPPTRRDPQGVNAAIWRRFSAEGLVPPEGSLTLASYSAGRPKTAYVRFVGVGDSLPEMPLFIDPEMYVLVALEATYQAAWSAVPLRWQRVLEAQ